MRQGDRIEAGYGEASLNAPLGASMPGYFQDRKATGVLDPLLAKAVVLRLGQSEGALVSLDLVAIAAAEVAAIRAAVEKATGIPGGQVWVHATHTHTGITIPRPYTSDAHEIQPGLAVGTVDAGWLAGLPDRVVEAVRAARANARPGPARLGQVKAEGVAFYRRFRMKDGSIRTNPGKNNPEVVAPAGSIDPTLTVVGFPASKTLLAIYGLHPDVIGGTRYSADYPHHLGRRVRERLGDDWGVLFLNAACGNINHVDVSNPAQEKGYAESTRIGQVLGDAAVTAWGKAEPMEVDALAFTSRVVASRLRTVPEADVVEAERLLREEPEKAQSFNGLFAPVAVVLGRTRDRELPAEVAALRLGPMGLVGLPGEIFVELAREIQHGSPFEPTRVIGLTNGALGYIPTAEAYTQGGYESGYRSARFEPRTGHRWAETAVQLLRRLA